MGRVNSINYLWGRISEPSVLVQIGFTVGLNRYQQDIPQYTYNFSEIQKKPTLCRFQVASFLLSSLYPKKQLRIVINTAY